MNTPIVLCVTLLALFAKSEQKYSVPEIKIEALKPKGIIVSLPDSKGVKHFAFHANINQPIIGKEDGTIFKEANNAQNGKWEIRDPNTQLKIGDEISYWVFVVHNQFGYDKQDQLFKVTELIDAPTILDDIISPCKPSITEVDGKKSCANEIIFEDTFDSFNEDKWLKEQYVPFRPDYEFNTYEKHAANNYIDNSNLVFKATLRKADISEIDLSNGCTRTNCKDDAYGTIVQPVIGARVKSKFHFKYGKIEIRAKLPKGDWLYPILYLEPKDNFYGEGYKSGRMWLAYARGNQDLKNGATGESIGNNILYSGPVLSRDNLQIIYKAHRMANKNGQLWGDEYHTFTVIWQPNKIRVSVDNSETKDITPPYAHPHRENIWSSSPNAPFDKDFVISLGIAVGGVNDFPDGSKSNGIDKPWKRTDSKARLKFNRSKDKWLSTWDGDNSALHVDYIKVWAI